MYTTEQFTAAMHAAVEERGAGFVYPDEWRSGGNACGMCKYVIGDRPGCLIGFALHKLGVSVEELRIAEGSAAAAVLHYRVGDPVTRSAARSAQVVQDNGGTWGEALAAYLRGIQ